MRGLAVRKKFTQLADFGPLRIRLQRFGRVNQAFYQIVVAQARFRRDGRIHDVVGMFSPHPTTAGYKHINLDFARTKQWLSVGAEPTGVVARLLSKVRRFWIGF
jgi:small subunit ribosomal protein S16